MFLNNDFKSYLVSPGRRRRDTESFLVRLTQLQATLQKGTSLEQEYRDAALARRQISTRHWSERVKNTHQEWCTEIKGTRLSATGQGPDSELQSHVDSALTS